jgi:hypothetical protein
MNPEAKDIKKNDTCYGKNGACAVVQDVLSNGALLVRPVVLVDLGEQGEQEGQGELDVWYEAYPKAPKYKWDAEIAALLAEKTKLQTEIGNLRRDSMNALNEAKAAERQRIDILTRHDKLKRLEDFLERRITHILQISWNGPSIIDIETWRIDEARKPADMKLLTLFGDSKGDLNWRLNSYGDGSGSSCEATPCTSLEQAKTLLSDYALRKFSDFRKNGNGLNYAEDAAASLQANGMDVPTDILEAVRASKIKREEASIAEIERNLATRQAVLASLQQ